MPSNWEDRQVPRTQPTKFVFVTGGVLSGLGKGITAASLGALFEARGFSVNIQKLDPYLNVDAGTLNPGEHGECFVTDDGAETDLDVGHYERFLDRNLTQSSSVMSGRILQKLIRDERAGKYLGKTVQVIPHFTMAIEEEILKAAKGFEIHIVEIGGTVGDYESPAFFEAIRELGYKVGHHRACYVQVVYLPDLKTSGEIKTKPAQNATRDLRSLGVMPNVLVARSAVEPGQEVADKLARMTGVDRKAVAMLPDADTIYRVPLTLNAAGVDSYILDQFKLPKRKADLGDWHRLVNSATAKRTKTRRVALVAKYMANEDTYFSVMEAVKAASWAAKMKVEITWVDAEKVNKTNVRAKLKGFDGIIVPGGFGARGIEGKVAAAGYAIDHNIPYLGLCLGLQVGVIAFARGKLGIKSANSLEVNPKAKEPVIYVMPDQRDKQGTGGTMRLGSYECALKEGSLARKLYGTAITHERHRHRYEVNNQYRDRLEKAGMVFSGIWKEKDLIEIIELKDHKFFLASQFHPELRSRPMRPHPMFKGLIAALA